MTELLPLTKVHALEAQEAIRTKLRAIETGWVEATIMFLNFKAREYYRPLGYDGFDAWLEAEIEESRASVRAKMRVVGKLMNAVPLAVLQGIPITNCQNLLKAPEGKRESLVERARTMPIKDFALVVGTVPGNSMQGEEARVSISLCFTASQMLVVDAAIEKVNEEHPCSKSSAIALICGNFLSGAANG